MHLFKLQIVAYYGCAVPCNSESHMCVNSVTMVTGKGLD